MSSYENNKKKNTKKNKTSTTTTTTTSTVAPPASAFHHHYDYEDDDDNDNNDGSVVVMEEDVFENEVIDVNGGDDDNLHDTTGGSTNHTTIFEMGMVASERKRKLIALGMVVFIAFWTVFLAIFIPTHDKNKIKDENNQAVVTAGEAGASSTPSPASVPSPSGTIVTEYPSPTRAPRTIGPTTSKFTQVMTILAPISLSNEEQQEATAGVGNTGQAVMPKVFQNPNTNQYLALYWLVYDDPDSAFLSTIDTYMNDEEIIQIQQRYIAALLYFSTHGENWNEDIQYLSQFHICKWNNDDVGIFCDDEDTEDEYEDNDGGDLPTHPPRHIITKLLFGTYVCIDSDYFLLLLVCWACNVVVFVIVSLGVGGWGWSSSSLTHNANQIEILAHFISFLTFPFVQIYTKRI